MCGRGLNPKKMVVVQKRCQTPEIISENVNFEATDIKARVYIDFNA